MFLSKEQLKELTDRSRPTAQIRWLDKNNYSYEISAEGMPKVLLSVVEDRLEGKIGKEPQLRLAS